MDIPEISPEDVSRKIIGFIENKIEKSQSNGVVIGLSGGLDSTVVAYLCSNLQNIDILGVSLPIDKTNEHARQVAMETGIQFKEIEIKRIINSYLDTLPTENSEPDNITKGNLIARTRMSLLYYHSNINNLIVVGTGNKSERYIGYFTKYGDGAADIMPIGDIYKTHVKQLARHLQAPKKIIEKKPSAGLWEGQTDEQEIGMNYDMLDSIIYLIDEENLSLTETSKKLSVKKELVEKVHKMHKKTMHKRKQPPVCKINI
ncbi:NAD+ synthase [Methanonatronarchaeum sp. AMET6-2]|uniref:NAD+ synthase n=1 Tax=Methanonatronarchaeum sp. AMET6-2 TaxID=2933293 RepID=UPI001211E2F7|nr:NAD+ synthase [Methanonatronarchaeum sp. AMET6-2]RZN63380.1 MAG: NAD+ synthase [Methanonatronarchaeia archaeon]UOY10598.1 NAD+ synthase [Methanonatronarchaeum sp. AMET6-2]